MNKQLIILSKCCGGSVLILSLATMFLEMGAAWAAYGFAAGVAAGLAVGAAT